MSIYADCINAWGEEAQLRILQEECAELIVAVSHFLRDRKTGVEELIEEIADVDLMIRQARYLVGDKMVNDIMEIKEARLRDRLPNKG